MTNRRDFIKTTAAGAAGIAIGGMSLSAKSYNQVAGSNDRIIMAVAGLRSRGRDHINSWCALKDNRNVRIKTICDVDNQFFPQAAKLILDRSGETATTESDMRRVFEDKDIDAVSFGLPNHWHALSAIWACQAGKHVYVEKPLTQTIYESRLLTKLAKQYGVATQMGNQGSSTDGVRQACAWAWAGEIGEVRKVDAWSSRCLPSLAVCRYCQGDLWLCRTRLWKRSVASLFPLHRAIAGTFCPGKTIGQAEAIHPLLC